MAGDWIPISGDLSGRREVLICARRAGKSPDEIVGRLVRFWAWVSSESEDGTLPGLTAADVASACRLPEQFVADLADVGWLEVSDFGVTVPNFERWLSRSAKRRMRDASRKKASREEPAASVRDTSAIRPHNVRTMSASNADKKRTTGQYRKEQKSIPPPPPNTTRSNAAKQEPDAGGGGGGFSGDGSGTDDQGSLWLSVEMRLAQLGLADAVTACRMARDRGLSVDEVEAVADVYEARRGAWGPGALHFRLAHSVPGTAAADGWPVPSVASTAEAEYREKHQAKVAREGRRLALVKRLRKAGKSPEEVDAAVAAAGL